MLSFAHGVDVKGFTAEPPFMSLLGLDLAHSTRLFGRFLSVPRDIIL